MSEESKLLSLLMLLGFFAMTCIWFDVYEKNQIEKFKIEKCISQGYSTVSFGNGVSSFCREYCK